MKSKFFPVFLAVIMLALASLACQALGGAEETAAPPQDAGSAADPASPAEEIPAPAADADAPALPGTVASQGAGMVCLGLRDAGLTCLDESGWKTYTQDNSDLASNYVTAGAVCPNGQIVLAHYDGLSLFDGSSWQNIAKTDSYSSADSVGCAADGSLWVAHFKGVSRYANGAWTTYGSELLASGESANELVYDAVPAADGRVWVVTSRSVAVFENDTWTVYQEGQGFDEAVFFNALTVDSLNRPWAGMSSGVAVFDEGAWRIIEKPGYNSPNSLAFDASGKLWFGTSISGVAMFNGNAWGDYTRQSGSLPSDSVNDVAADSQGRIWLGTSYGLVVFDGSNWQIFRMDNSDIGDNEIKFIAVVKDGPTLPAPADKEKGSMTGKLETASNQPLTGMRVEICVESLGSQFSGETPCSDQPFFLSTETDENGVFSFAEVPAGYYVLVAETGDGWAQLTTQFGIGSERTPVQAGEDYDIGTLTLEEE